MIQYLRNAALTGAVIACVFITSFAQPGNIIETGDSVLDPNGDGYISISDAGFIGDGFDVDEFEIRMFGVPIFGDGEALKDIASGSPCGVSDLALDTAGFALYAGYDDNQNLIFRFRLASNKPSVQSYTVLIDSDQSIGSEDANSNSINPGFEIEITMIQSFGVFIYGIDGIESCPTPLKAYSMNTHQQKATSSLESCNTTDYFLDFYVPFSDLEELFGIDENTELRFVGVTNISATCMLDGSISDIGGVDDTQYDGCFSCAILDLTENQCPSGVANLCETCAGFPIGITETPEIDKPVLVGDTQIHGTSESDAFIFIQVYSDDGTLQELDTTMSDSGGLWISNEFSSSLDFGDSIVVNALLPGRCQSGLNDAGLSFAIVSPNQPPVISGETLTLTYTENQPPVTVAADIIITDDNNELIKATIAITSGYESGFDMLTIDPFPGLTGQFSEVEGAIVLIGTTDTDTYMQALGSVQFHNTSELPDLAIRTISFIVFDEFNASNEFKKNIIITEVNDAPELTLNGDPVDTLFFSTEEDTPLEICLDAQDVDGEVFEITNTIVKDDNGLIDILEGLCLLFSPSQDFSGTEFVHVTVCDDGSPSLCTDAVLVIEITPVNDAPQVIDEGIQTDSISFKTLKNTGFEFCLEGFDIEGNAISVNNITLSDINGSVITENGLLCFNYVPGTNFTGFETLEITICDDGLPSECSTVIIEIEVIPFNTAPVISNDTLYITLNKNTSIEVCIEASDVDNDELHAIILEKLIPDSDTEESSPLCFNYSPPFDFFGDDLIKLIVCDDVIPALCDTVYVAFTVLPVNNAPGVWENDIIVDTLYFQTKINTPVDFCIDARDPDQDVIQITSIQSAPGNGTALTIAPLCVSYSPENDFTGFSWITITLCDNGIPEECIIVAVGIEVLPSNSPPVITLNGIETDTLRFQTFADTPLEICLEALDPDGDEIAISGIEEITSGGFYIPGDGNLCLEFIPEEGFTGQTIHNITVCDNGIPEECDNVIIVIEVLKVNHAPTILLNGIPTDTLLFSTPALTALSFCIETEDIDGDLTFIEDSGQVPENGIIMLESTRSLCMQYTPAGTFLGTDWFTVTVCDDDTPELCDTVVIGINVFSVNTSPQIHFNGEPVDSVTLSGFEGILISQTFSVIDNEDDDVVILSQEIISGNGQFDLLLNGDIQFNYTPEISSAGFHHVKFTVCDNGLPILCDSVFVEIRVDAVNNPPVAVNDSIVSVEGEMVTGNVLLNDSDPDNDSIIVEVNLIAEPESGVIEITITGSFEYIPDLGFTGTEHISYTISDVREDKLMAEALIVIEIEPADRSITVFEALSPNGDGLNEFWLIQGLEHFPNNVVRIFDRWNNFIFETHGYNNANIVWRGESNKGLSKKDVGDGTYFYIIIPGDGSPQLSGNVILKR